MRSLNPTNNSSGRLDTLKFRVTNPSIGYTVLVENIFVGIIGCSSKNPFLQSVPTRDDDHKKTYSEHDLPFSDMSVLTQNNSIASLTGDIWEIEAGSTLFFRVPLSLWNLENACDEAAKKNCDVTNSNDEFLLSHPLGSSYLIVSFIDPISGKNTKISQLLYQGDKNSIRTMGLPLDGPQGNQ